MNIFRRKQQVSQTSLTSKSTPAAPSSSSSGNSQQNATAAVAAKTGPTLSASSAGSSSSGAKTNEHTMTSISPIGKKQAIPPVIAASSNASAAATGLVPITQSALSVSLAGHQTSPSPQVTLPSIINSNNSPAQRATPSLLGGVSPNSNGLLGEMRLANSTTNLARPKPAPPTSLFAAPSTSSSSSSSSNANSKIIRNKMKDLKADLDSENSSQAKLEPGVSNLSIGDKISRPSALAPFTSSALPSSPSDFNMPNVFLGTPRTRTRLVDFHLGSESVPSYTRINNQLSSATSSDSDKNANFSDFVNHASSSHRSLQKFTPNGLHPFQQQQQQQPTSSSRSSSTSSMSLSLSSSSSSIPPSSFSTVSRLEAVNSEKFREILKNNGYLTLNGERIKSTMSDLVSICELGRGTCGHVMKMKHVPTGTIMAVKQMSISGIQEENKRIIMDLDIAVKSHDCKEIVRCLGYFISESDVWICMELMTMCFDKLLKLKKVPIPEPILGKLTVSTLNALTYLKDVHHIIHRDVKPSNILIDENGEIKLCDFGISGNLINSNAHTRSNTGCAGYMAPERIEIDQSNPVYDIRADVWSMGISLVELATGEYPYKGCRNEFEVMSKIIESPAPRLEGDQFSDDFKSFIEKCLIRDVKQRPKYNALVQHAFVLKYKSEQVDVRAWFRSILAENQLLRPAETTTTTEEATSSHPPQDDDKSPAASESSSTTPTVNS